MTPVQFRWMKSSELEDESELLTDKGLIQVT